MCLALVAACPGLTRRNADAAGAARDNRNGAARRVRPVCRSLNRRRFAESSWSHHVVGHSKPAALREHQMVPLSVATGAGLTQLDLATRGQQAATLPPRPAFTSGSRRADAFPDTVRATYAIAQSNAGGSSSERRPGHRVPPPEACCVVSQTNRYPIAGGGMARWFVAVGRGFAPPVLAGEPAQ